jgi:hypothetical protein
VGAFAEEFDLISSQYGWTDEQILDLPFGRYMQIISAIRIRKYMDNREENARISWLGRAITSFVAAGYMTDGDNPAIEMANQLSIDDIEHALLSYDSAEAWKPGDKAIVKNEPSAGSFETLMRALS